MAYDEGLAERIREVVAEEPGVTEKKMFGGLAFLASGNMFCGILKDELMVRVGPDGHEAALARPHARIMDFTGRPMKGFLVVGTGGFERDEDLESWVRGCLDFVRTLPAK